MNLVKVSDIFDVKYGINLELINCEITSDKGIPFVSRTSSNNGVSAFVKPIDGLTPNPANTISVACGGSVMESFLQEKPYYSGFHVLYLTPKQPLNSKQMLYYCMCLRANAWKFNYGRQANKALKDLLIPDVCEIPNYVNNAIIPQVSNKSLINKQPPLLNISKWEWFEIGLLFDSFEKCKCSNARDLLEKGQDIYYIGAKKTNNGIMNLLKYENSLVTKGNCILFIGDGQGSVGYSLYQPKDFIGSTTLSVGFIKNLNPYIALFLVTIIDMEREKYSFGRKFGLPQVKKTKIKLPAIKQTDGTYMPNWQFMEDYIKSLPYSSSL